MNYLWITGKLSSNFVFFFVNYIISEKCFLYAFFMNFCFFFFVFLEIHPGKLDQKWSKYPISGIAVYFFLVLSCLILGDDADIEHTNVCDFTAKHFSQLIFEEKWKTVNDRCTPRYYIGRWAVRWLDKISSFSYFSCVCPFVKTHCTLLFFCSCRYKCV